MKLPKIHLSDKSLSYKEFSDQFGEFFIISDADKKEAAMKSEYERITGRKAITDKKKNESSGSKGNNRKAESNDSGSDAKADIGESEKERAGSD